MTKYIQVTLANTYCDKCGKDLESWRGGGGFEFDGEDYCSDCAYKFKKISKRQWAEANGMLLSDRTLRHLEI